VFFKYLVYKDMDVETKMLISCNYLLGTKQIDNYGS
jgi:hypothetical protein